MTVDELRKIYDDAFTPIVTSATCADSEFANVIAEAERAGVTAVVRALRDEIDRIWTSDDTGCGTIIDLFDQILGDAGEKVAGMGPMEDESRIRYPVPATNPAPALYAGQDPKIPLNTDAAPDKNWAGALQWEADCKAALPAAAPAFYAGQDPKIPLNTDAAPAVCEWEDGGMWLTTQCGKRFGYPAGSLRICPACKAPIKFTEAK